MPLMKRSHPMGVEAIIDYPVIGIADNQERWVRSTARLFTESGVNRRMLCGTLIDITETKKLEQKKMIL